MDAFLNYADIYFFVAAATTSESAKLELQDQFASYFAGERVSIERVDLKSHTEVAKWKDKTLFTLGRTPDIVVANVGKLLLQKVCTKHRPRRECGLRNRNIGRERATI